MSCIFNLSSVSVITLYILTSPNYFPCHIFQKIWLRFRSEGKICSLRKTRFLHRSLAPSAPTSPSKIMPPPSAKKSGKQATSKKWQGGQPQEKVEATKKGRPTLDSSSSTVATLRWASLPLLKPHIVMNR